MHRRTRLAVAASLSAATFAAALALVHGATAGTRAPAAPPPAVDGARDEAAPAAPAAPALVAAIARDFGLTPRAARQRLAAEHRASVAADALRGALGDSYAGAWVARRGELTVAVLDQAAAEAAEAAGASPKLVPRNESVLEAVQSALDARAARAPKRVTGWYVDVQMNAVVVQVRGDTRAPARRFVRAAGVDRGAVRYEATAGSSRPYLDVVGGNAYHIGGSTRCSIGFSVGGGFVTAGHCGRVNASTSQPTGTVAGSSFPGNDYAWVRVAAGNTPQPLVNGYGDGDVTITGSQDAAIGSTVCRSGSTTGWHCGTITARNASVIYPQGIVNGLIRTTVCAEAGDSGGSLVAGSQAQGVTSGGSGSCRTGGTTYFQPVNEILQVYGLSLVTSGSSTPPPTTSPPAPTTAPSMPTTTPPTPTVRTAHRAGRRWAAPRPGPASRPAGRYGSTTG